jgi:hypothetical protein
MSLLAPWRSGYAAACKAVYTGSIPVGAFHASSPGPDCPDRGIAFEVGVFDRTPRNGVDGGAYYSAPAVKRGILSVEARPRRRPDFPEITVVGMALNKAVKAVEVTYFDGSTRRLVPGPIRPSQVDGSTVANFDYIAFAMRGPWCAQRLVTLDRRSDPLWETELSGSEVDEESVSRAACPGFTAASLEPGN